MATLLELTSQGTSVAPADEGRHAQIALMDPQALYELWERQPWAAHAIDLGSDQEDWRALSGGQRAHIAWNLSTFFLGEERVATQFSGLVRAYESQAEEAYLTTQQVDEARHAQFFDRFLHQVAGWDGTFEARLQRVRESVDEAFRVLFDDHLADAEQRLLADPGDVDAKIDFVTLYHMLIEGVLALTGQYFITQTLETLDVLPGFREGFAKIAQDEHRHVAYGTWFLREKVREDPRHGERIQARLLELLPITSAVLVPADRDLAPGTQVMGAPPDVVNRFAFTSLARRLKVIGIALPAMA